ncbi:lipocalin-like domain-containing protein [Sneathiella chinensis]|uniref:Iron ABC transporter permease n=1 Tax=Sneathiella chinensis TaxID=349750 RepID=A0ABQ5U2P1_9PROT|nr:lipocalin-like domain-containing protein [Sneathiella chinensis]GLQ05930.1 iron ABC transporter permease [Sneathiella chinensis]
MNARPLLVLLALVTLVALVPASLPAQGYGGLGTTPDAGYETVLPDKPLTFPQDHSAHPGFRIEWWYVTANLEDQNGVPMGLQWTLFRNALTPQSEPLEGWGNRQFWLGHSAVTTKSTHYSDERYARGGVGQAGVSLSPFAAWIDQWQMTGLSVPPKDFLHKIRLQATSDTYQYDVTLTAKGPLIRHGRSGYSIKSDEGQASYYYSQPFYEVSGLIILDGERHTVRGKAWLDREWSSQPLAENQSGWDWFSLHLEDGRKLMAFQLRHTDGKTYSSGTLISTEGSAAPLAPEALSFTPLEKSTVAGREIPTKWRVSVPGEGLSLTVTALNPQSWMENSFGYWEGPVRIDGAAGGVGYLEMTGY